MGWAKRSVPIDMTIIILIDGYGRCPLSILRLRVISEKEIPSLLVSNSQQENRHPSLA